MDSFIKYAEKKGVNYIEIKNSENKGNIIEAQNGEIKELSSNESKLYAVRLQYKNSIGIAYSNVDNYKELVDKAIKAARALNKNVKLNFESNNEKIKTKAKIKLEDVGLEEKKRKILDLEKLKNRHKGISTLNLVYSDNIKNINYTNSEGADLNWEDNSVGLRSWAYSKKGNRNENYLKAERKHSGYEFMESSEEFVKENLDIATKLLSAKSAKGGSFPVIVDQKLGGVFAHEAIGHGCEADIVLAGGSVLKDKLNTKIGNDCINIIDDGSLQTNGWTPFDDDLVLGKKTFLVKNGILSGYLHNLETASLMKMEPTGNGRSQSLMHSVIPRMTTTYIGAGDSNFNEMLKGIKEGYYLKESFGGQVDTIKGEFLFNSMYGYYIKNGEVSNMIKGTAMIGNILQTLHEISLIGKDLEFSGGTCGKDNQLAPVGDGSPHFKINNVKVGGA